jgi:hypothetical protein
MAMTAALTGIAAHAEENVQTDETRVTVCTEGNADPRVGAPSQAIASQMYAAIGVTIDWRQRLGGCPSQGVRISLTHFTRPTLLPGALAYALPYEGAHIQVFYDRIAGHGRDLLPYLLAHVMAHEIAHILQGINRHSEQCLMKARWTEEDYECMMRKPLEFSSHDADLIHRGLTARAATIHMSHSKSLTSSRLLRAPYDVRVKPSDRIIGETRAHVRLSLGNE